MREGEGEGTPDPIDPGVQPAVALLHAALLPGVGVERLLVAVERHDPEKRAEDDGERPDEKQNRGHAMTPDGKRFSRFAPADQDPRPQSDRRERIRFHCQDPIGAVGLFRMVFPIPFHSAGRNP